MTIKKGESCEFEIFIKPLCTCHIKVEIMIVALDLKKGKQFTYPIKFEAITQIAAL